MKNLLFLTLTILSIFTVAGCSVTPSAHPTAWIIDNSDVDAIVINEGADSGTTFTVHPWPAAGTPKKSTTVSPPVFRGKIIAAVPDCGQIRLFFDDGTILAGSKDSIAEKADASWATLALPDTSGRFLAAARAGKEYYALMLENTGRLRLCRLRSMPDNALTIQWKILPIALPCGAPAPLMALSSCGENLLFAWRSGNNGGTLSGWQAAVLEEDVSGSRYENTVSQNKIIRDDCGGSRWHWLPSPPDNALNRSFAVCADGNGLLLAQDDPANQRIIVTRFTPAAPRPGTTTELAAALSGGVWTRHPIISFPAAIYSRPALSLSITNGAHGLRLARTTADGVRLLAAPHFPDDPGAEVVSPRPEKDENRYDMSRILWWIVAAMLVVTLAARRWAAVKLQHYHPESTNKTPSSFARAYQDAFKMQKLTKIGGIASVFDRALALIFDGMICMALPFGYVAICGIDNWAASFSVYFLWLSGIVVYSIIAEMLWGCTPGKALFKLHVRNVEGGRPTFWQIFIRNIFRFIDFFPVTFGGVNLWYIIAAAFAFSTVRSQRLGDLIASTMVRYHCRLDKREIILASASPQRAVLLKMLGLDFRIAPSFVPEKVDSRQTPPETALSIAEAKAEAVAKKSSERALIIAADTIVIADDKILGKPADDADAKRMLRLLSGRRHTVATAVVLVDNATGQRISDCAFTEVVWRELSESDIETYIQTGEHRGRAGAYGIQGEAAQFTTLLEGSLANVIGLPLEMLTDMLKDLDA